MNIQSVTPVRFTSIEDEIISQNLSKMFFNGNKEVVAARADNFSQNQVAQPEQIEKPQKKSLFEGFLNFIGNVKKVFVNITDWTAGTLKGLGLGGLLGGMTTGAMFLGNIILNGAKREGAHKPANKPLFIGSGIAIGLLAFLKTLYDTKLSINKKSHDIDVKYVSTPMITK